MPGTPTVGGFVDELGGRFARAVPARTSMRISTGVLPALRGLQRGRELEAVCRDDAVVVVAGRDQRGAGRPRRA